MRGGTSPADTTMKKIIALLVLLYSIPHFSQSNEKQEDNNIYATTGIDVKPNFPGGLDRLNAIVKESIQKAGFETKTKEKVVYLFVVEKDGTLTDIKMLDNVDPAKVKELIRILKILPKWNPGKQNGQTVRVLYALPVVIGN